jgi:hypothetical protein
MKAGSGCPRCADTGRLNVLQDNWPRAAAFSLHRVQSTPTQIVTHRVGNEFGIRVAQFAQGTDEPRVRRW